MLLSQQSLRAQGWPTRATASATRSAVIQNTGRHSAAKNEDFTTDFKQTGQRCMAKPYLKRVEEKHLRQSHLPTQGGANASEHI